jgi:hypothetical protein
MDGNLDCQAAKNWRISQKVDWISGVGVRHRVLKESVAGSYHPLDARQVVRIKGVLVESFESSLIPTVNWLTAALGYRPPPTRMDPVTHVYLRNTQNENLTSAI